jgi:hypothetical protein
MKITPKGSQNTGFQIWDYSSPSPGASIGSVQIYNTGGWRVDYDANLNGNTLEVVVNGVIKPNGFVTMALSAAHSTLFQSYVPSSSLSYDKATKTISGPQGSKLEIILKDNCSMSKGKEDRYECIL